MSFTSLPPLSLYIHTPWCVQKCPYCDFNSHSIKSTIPEDEYINALLADLANEMPRVWGRQLISIFVGGGTPSLLKPESYEKLFSGIRSLIPFQSDIEITLEANPGTAEAEKFAGFVEAGFNRISIGVQSFNDQHLQSLGRIHNAIEAEKAFSIARDSGFNNINLDLMYALPNQSIEQMLSDINTAISFAPEHLSWYQLTLEPNTLFYHQPPKLPNDEIMDTMGDTGLTALNHGNYQRYEVSAYSRNGQSPSQHNLNYWQFGDYIGIGAGAHGKITRADEQSITRTSKKRNPKDYLNLQHNFIEQTKITSKDELPLEFMMNAMRLKDGIDKNLFFARTGLIYSHIEQAINKAKQQDLLQETEQQLLPTDKGYQFLNELLAYFMPENFPSLKDKNTITIKQV